MKENKVVIGKILKSTDKEIVLYHQKKLMIKEFIP
jgi:hypothetical protein